MKKLLASSLSFITNPLTIAIVLFLAQLGLFLWMTLRPFTINIPNRSYNILRGQGAYTSFLRQAKEGEWRVYSPYMTRPTPVVYIQLFYIVLGKIAAIFSIDPVFMYTVTRIISGLILFASTLWFIRIIVPKSMQPVAVLFTLGLEPGPLITAIKNLQTVLTAPPAIFSYFQQEIAQRHFGLPHHVLSEALGLLLLGSVFLYVKNRSWQRLVMIGLLTLAGTLIMPAYNSVIVLTVCIAWGIWSLVHGDIKRIILPFMIIAVIMVLVALFTKSQMDVGYPSKNFNLDEKRWVTDAELLVNYLSSLLVYLPATVIFWVSLPRMWRQLHASIKLLAVLLTSWVIGPLLYIPLTHFVFFPFANFRLIDGYAYVPMGILSAFGVFQLAISAHKRWMVGVGISLMLTLSLLLTADYTRQTFIEQYNIWSNVYPYNDEWNAIHFISRVPRQSGVLVMKYVGEIIPSYASVRVYLGETPGFIDWEDRYFEAIKFYRGTLSDSDARAWLSREDISYVWWGQDEKPFLTATALYPNILVPVFRTPHVTVFQVMK